MNISEAAKKTGVTAKTIRYYESVGLMPSPTRAENGYRHFSPQDIETLRFISRARKLGFSLKDVQALLALWQDKSRASADVKAMALKHIDDLEERIKEMRSIRDTLVHLTKRCHGDDRPDCPILEEIAKGA